MRTLFLIMFFASISLTSNAEILESLPPCNLGNGGPLDASALLEMRECVFDRPISLTLNYIIVDSLGHPVDSEDYGACRHYDSKEWQESNRRQIKKLGFAQALLAGHPEIVSVRVAYYRNGKERGAYPSVDKLCAILKSFSPALQNCIFDGNKRGYPRIVINIGR